MKEESQLKYWFLWEVVMPLLLLGLFYPAHYFVLNSGDPFSEAFGRGDLLLFGGLLLTSVTVQIKLREMEWQRMGGTASLGFLRDSARVVAIVFIFVYGAVRFHCLFVGENLDSALEQGYAGLGWAVAVLAIAIGCYGLIKAERQLQLAQLERK